MIDVCFGIWEGFISIPFPVVFFFARKNVCPRYMSCRGAALCWCALKENGGPAQLSPNTIWIGLVYMYHPKTHAQVFPLTSTIPKKN